MRTLIVIILSLWLSGCAAVATGLVYSVGAGFGISHRVNGTNYRTFTEPLPRVKSATLTALKRMAIDVLSTQKTKTGEVLKATANDRRIEVEFEALTPNATRMRSVAMEPGGLVLDSATGWRSWCRPRRCSAADGSPGEVSATREQHPRGVPAIHPDRSLTPPRPMNLHGGSKKTPSPRWA